MPNLPISGLQNLTAATNSSLIAIVASGVTYNINIEDLWKSQPFGTMYQDWIPDAASAHTIGSIAYPLKSIYVSTGSVFIGPNNSIAIDDSGVLYSTNVFAAPTFQVGNVTSLGQVVTTSGVTFSAVNNEMLMISNSGGTVTNLTRQPVPTGGTINQVLTQTGNTNYAWGWVDFTGGTSGTSGTSGIDGSSGTSGTSGAEGSSGTSGTSGADGSSGTSGTSFSPPYPVVYGLFSQTGTTTVITGTTEQTMVNGGVGTLTVGANQFQVGDSFDATFSGLITNTNNHTVRFRIESDSGILADSGAISIAANNAAVFYLQLNFVIRAIGGAGTASIYTVGAFQTSKTSNASLEGFGFDDLNNTTFDTTIPNTLDVTLEFGTTGDSLQVELFRLNKTF